MKRIYSTITLNFDNLDKDIITSELENKLISRKTSCHMIMNLTKIKPGFSIIRRTNQVKSILEQYREHSDKIVKQSTILVNSKPAKFIARIFMQMARPSCPTSIEIVRN